MGQKWLIGLRIYSWILVIVSLFSFIIGFGMAMSAGSPEHLLRLCLILAPIGLLVSSIGLLLLKNWARYLFIISAIIMSIVLIYLTLGDKNWIGVTSGFIFFIIMGIYLFTRPKAIETVHVGWKMKRIIMGIIWFIVFQIFFNLIDGLLFSVFNPGAIGQHSLNTLHKFYFFTFILSIALAAVGTVTGKLPGTKKQ